MLTLVISLLILTAILLVIIVLVQDSKGGIGAQSSATQLMGVKRTGDLLERLTWGFAIAIMVFAVASSFIMKSEDTDGPASVNIEKAASKRPAAPAPAAPTAQPEGQAPATNPDGSAPQPAAPTPADTAR